MSTPSRLPTPPTLTTDPFPAQVHTNNATTMTRTPPITPPPTTATMSPQPDTSTIPILPLSPIWRALPHDLAENIFSVLVNQHLYTDPAYTWTKLRQLSAHQKRVIERVFGEVWVPRLGVTVYTGSKDRFEYYFGRMLPLRAGGKGESPEIQGNRVLLTVDNLVHWPMMGVFQTLELGRHARELLVKAWRDTGSWKGSKVVVRLGEGTMKGGCRGAYLMNDTSLPGLEVLENGDIVFDWKGAMDELLREEMYMRRVGDEMFSIECEKWLDSPEGKSRTITTATGSQEHPPLKVQLNIWRGKVQIARRLAALKHRVAKSLSTPTPLEPKFSAISQWLHDQDADPESLAAFKGLKCCLRCSRWQSPDIFEVVVAEESVVPLLPVFQTWLEQTEYTKNWQAALADEADGTVGLGKIIGLYRDEIVSSLCAYENYGPDSCAPTRMSTYDIGDYYADPQRPDGQGGEGLRLESIQVGKRPGRWRQYTW
ncbi:hypothetical protein B0J18DRAFT_465285 [Chaetomium sp. MPI-SDFR-AT-0129]|nr:hypothetical protein B0J18DRAFT_465285 [Chaetomium sp. MPI-SDFR-AT-0129]